MSKLQEIMNEVSKERYDCSWAYAFTFMHPEDVEDLMKEVALRYAKEVARHNLERAAEKAKVLVSNGESTVDVKSWTLEDGIRFSPDYRRITSLEIELI